MIAFSSARTYSWGVQKWDIYLMNADGTGQTRLTHGEGSDPSWSPDGTKIAFMAPDATTTASGINVINIDGSNHVQIGGLVGSNPDWSPDGTKLVFTHFQDVYIMNSDGTGIVAVTDDDYEDMWPAWSPDGSTIAYTSERNNNFDIYAIGIDGTGLTRLTDDPAVDWQVSWSPDGSKLLFSSQRPETGGYGAIYVMNSDGTQQTRIVLSGENSSLYTQFFPEWSP